MAIKTFKTSFLKSIGPGFLLAGAAIGVSHLVQATRAGADYGFVLIWALVLACVSKYPFLEFGPDMLQAQEITLSQDIKNWVFSPIGST